MATFCPVSQGQIFPFIHICVAMYRYSNLCLMLCTVIRKALGPIMCSYVLVDYNYIQALHSIYIMQNIQEHITNMGKDRLPPRLPKNSFRENKYFRVNRRKSTPPDRTKVKSFFCIIQATFPCSYYVHCSSLWHDVNFLRENQSRTHYNILSSTTLKQITNRSTGR